MSELELDCLTFYGDDICIQVRDNHLAIAPQDSIEFSTENGHPMLIMEDDVKRLVELLEAAKKRGCLGGGAW